MSIDNLIVSEDLLQKLPERKQLERKKVLHTILEGVYLFGGIGTATGAFFSVRPMSTILLGGALVSTALNIYHRRKGWGYEMQLYDLHKKTHKKQ